MTMDFKERLLGKYRDLVRRAIGNRIVFSLFQGLGIHLTPVEFYSPVPDTRGLNDRVFARISECRGISWNEREQKRLLSEVMPRYADEDAFAENPGLSRADRGALHCVIRHFAPQNIVEVGSGFSTTFIAKAAGMNKAENRAARFVAIDPYPRIANPGDIPHLDELIVQKVQDVDEAILTAADFIFIDSSHVVRIGGDVNRLILDILPAVKSGCIIHFHDILLPGEYWKDWVYDTHYFWSEQYLLQAFLCFNDRFEIIWAAHYMQLFFPDEIAAVFPCFEKEKHRLTSFYIRKK